MMVPTSSLTSCCLLAEIDGLLGAGQGAGRAVFAVAVLQQETVGRIDGVGRRQRPGEGPVDGRPLAQAHLKVVGDLAGQHARLGAFAAGGAAGRIDKARLVDDGGLEVADVALDVSYLAVGQDLDVGVLHGPHHLAVHQRAGVLQAGKGLVELGHAPAQAGLLFHQIDLVPGVGDVERRLEAGDPAADDQGSAGDVHLTLLERLEQGGLGRRAGDQLLGLLGADLDVGVDPRALLPDVGHLKVVGVEAGVLDDVAEGDLVHAGRAGGDHHPGQAIVADVLADHLLTGVGAHVHVVAGHSHVGQRSRIGGHLLRIHGGRDIDPTMADVNTNSGWHLAS